MTVQTECRELALCRGAARSRTICVQRYAFSMNMDTEFSFFYLYTYLIIYKLVYRKSEI